MFDDSSSPAIGSLLRRILMKIVIQAQTLFSVHHDDNEMEPASEPVDVDRASPTPTTSVSATATGGTPSRKRKAATTTEELQKEYLLLSIETEKKRARNMDLKAELIKEQLIFFKNQNAQRPTQLLCSPIIEGLRLTNTYDI